MRLIFYLILLSPLSTTICIAETHFLQGDGNLPLLPKKDAKSDFFNLGIWTGGIKLNYQIPNIPIRVGTGYSLHYLGEKSSDWQDKTWKKYFFNRYQIQIAWGEVDWEIGIGTAIYHFIHIPQTVNCEIKSSKFDVLNNKLVPPNTTEDSRLFFTPHFYFRLGSYHDSMLYFSLGPLKSVEFIAQFKLKTHIPYLKIKNHFDFKIPGQSTSEMFWNVNIGDMFPIYRLKNGNPLFLKIALSFSMMSLSTFCKNPEENATRSKGGFLGLHLGVSYAF